MDTEHLEKVQASKNQPQIHYLDKHFGEHLPDLFWTIFYTLYGIVCDWYFLTYFSKIRKFNSGVVGVQ